MKSIYSLFATTALVFAFINPAHALVPCGSVSCSNSALFSVQSGSGCSAGQVCECLNNSAGTLAATCITPCTGMHADGSCPPGAPATTKDTNTTSTILHLNLSKIYSISRSSFYTQTNFTMTGKGSFFNGTYYPPTGQSVFTINFNLNPNAGDSAATTSGNQALADNCFKIALQAMTLMKLNYNDSPTTNVTFTMDSPGVVQEQTMMHSDMNNNPLVLYFFSFPATAFGNTSSAAGGPICALNVPAY